MKTFYLLLASFCMAISAMAQTSATIYEIQGQTTASPLVDEIVITQGIVTGVSFNGYYIQDGTGPWNGVFVFDNQNDPVMGDLISVTAKVQEYYEMTELGYVSNVTIQSSGNTLPEPSIITAQQASMEDYESILIRVNNVTVTELPNQYGIWKTEDENNGELLVDDDIYQYNPSVGEQLSLIGVMTYTFSEHKINPRSLDDVIGGSSGQEVSIYDIQGQTDLSPYEGAVVTTSGIVTGVAFNGYFIQDGNGPWTGLFVFDSENIPEIGDDVTVTGEVQEYYDMTELGYISAFSVESHGNQLPDIIPVTALQIIMEDYESVLVGTTDVEVTDMPDQYGVWRGVNSNGDLVVIDDNIFAYTPVIGEHLNITGCIMYNFNEFKINPRSADDITPYNAIAENTGNVRFFIFPNPATDVVTISADQIITGVNVYDATGALVIQRDGLNVNSVTQYVSSLSQGIYMIKVLFNDQTIATQKLSIR